MYNVYKDPDGKYVFDAQNSDHGNSKSKACDKTGYNSDVRRSKIEILNVEIFKLRSEIAQVHTHTYKC